MHKMHKLLKTICLLSLILSVTGCGLKTTYVIGDKVKVSLDGQIGQVNDVSCSELLFNASEDVCFYTVVIPLEYGSYKSTVLAEKLLSKAI